MVRLNDSLFAIAADLINDMIKMSVCLAFSFIFLVCTSEREMNWWARGYNLPGIISDLCKDSPCWMQQWYYCFFHSLFLWFSVYILMPVRFQSHPVHVQYHAWQMGILGMFSWIRMLAQADIWSICSASAAAADRIFSTISGNGCSQCHSSHCRANTWIVCWMLKVVLRGEHSLQLILQHHTV